MSADDTHLQIQMHNKVKGNKKTTLKTSLIKISYS